MAVNDLPWPAAPAAGAAIGAVVGSFIALVSLRWPAGRPFAVARSACGGCGATLRPVELIPLVSFAVQLGRCRRCAARIPWRYPAVEAAAAAIGALSVVAAPLPTAASIAVLGWTLLLLAILDAEHYWLPSAVTWPLTAIGLVVTALLRRAALSDHVIGAVAGFTVLMLVAAGYRRLRGRDGLGGGDAKLFAAAGAWLGWAALPLVLGSAALAAIVVALLLLRRGLTSTTRLPFGTFLAPAIWIIALAG